MSYEVIGAKFVASADTPAKLKLRPLKEFAFIGRSNVGKSSLLNSLTNQKSLARVSKTPGRTRAFNFFEIEYRESGTTDREQIYFVDLPGFGYAAVSHELQALWGRTIANYLQTRKKLAGMLLLVDSRRDVDEKEQWVVEQATSGTFAGRFAVVLTKADKISKGAGEAKRRALARTLGISVSQIFLTSTLKGSRKGLPEVLNYIIDDD